jgi:hypothetical protein
MREQDGCPTSILWPRESREGAPPWTGLPNRELKLSSLNILWLNLPLQCVSGYCHWTTFHTAAYIVEDAEAHIARVQYRDLGVNIPPALNKPLGLAAPPEAPPTHDGTGIPCATPTCRTGGGSRTRGFLTCIEYKCKSCCNAAYHNALASHTPRNSCQQYL